MISILANCILVIVLGRLLYLGCARFPFQRTAQLSRSFVSFRWVLRMKDGSL